MSQIQSLRAGVTLFASAFVMLGCTRACTNTPKETSLPSSNPTVVQNENSINTTLPQTSANSNNVTEATTMGTELSATSTAQVYKVQMDWVTSGANTGTTGTGTDSGTSGTAGMETTTASRPMTAKLSFLLADGKVPERVENLKVNILSPDGTVVQPTSFTISPSPSDPSQVEISNLNFLTPGKWVIQTEVTLDGKTDTASLEVAVPGS